MGLPSNKSQGGRVGYLNTPRVLLGRVKRRRGIGSENNSAHYSILDKHFFIHYISSCHIIRWHSGKRAKISKSLCSGENCVNLLSWKIKDKGIKFKYF